MRGDEARASDLDDAGTATLRTAGSRSVADVEGRENSDEAVGALMSGSTAGVPPFPSNAGLVMAADANTMGEELSVHNVTVWDGLAESAYLHVSFAPVSLERFFADVSFRKAVLGGEEVEVADVAPALDEEHVAVAVDGKPATVKSVQWYYAGYSDLSGADTKYMPVCIIRVERPGLESGIHRVTVSVEDTRTGASGVGESEFECGAWSRGI